MFSCQKQWKKPRETRIMQSYLVSAECRVCYLPSIILNWTECLLDIYLCVPGLILMAEGKWKKKKKKKKIWKLVVEERWLTNWLDLDHGVCPHLALLWKLLDFFSVKVCFYENMKFGIGSDHFPKADVNAYQPFLLSTWRDAALTVHGPESSYLHASSHKSWRMQSYHHCEHRACRSAWTQNALSFSSPGFCGFPHRLPKVCWRTQKSFLYEI